jgi:serine/threonine-protein kinase
MEGGRGLTDRCDNDHLDREKRLHPPLCSGGLSEALPKPFGAYALLKALGRGAMGDVHLARPMHAKRGIPTPIVVKRLHGELANQSAFVARFRHEAEIAVSVDSPHVAKVYDVGAVGETLYIVMEYVTGWPLSKVLDSIVKSGQHASIASVIDSIAGGLMGLNALHTARDREGRPLGIVHRDISPKNLMIGEDGIMRLIDLGLGKSNAQDWKTRTGMVMGSVGYMPPEQIVGDKVDARADLYAMGVVAYEMVALRNFIKRDSLQKMMEQSLNPKFQPPSMFRPDVPRGLDEILERAVKPMAEDRFQSAKALLDALRSVIPETRTSGGMRQLVDELFGETRREREKEMNALLALSIPEDPVELEPTRVFVQRDGVQDAPEPTRMVADPPRTIVMDAPPEMTAVSGMEETRARTFATELSSKGAVHSQQPIIIRERTGVSMTVLLISVLVAGAVGALIVVLMSDLLEPKPVPLQGSELEVVHVEAPPVVEAVKPVAHAETPAPHAEEKPAPQAPKTSKHSTPHTQHPSTTVAEEKPLEAKPAETAISGAQIEKRVSALMRRVDALLDKSPSDEQRRKLLKLKGALEMNLGAQGSQVDGELKKLDQEIRDLGG